MCEDPLCVGHGRTQAQILAETRSKIRKHGWVIFGVLDNPGFAYTVGLTAKRLPELYYSLDAPGTPDSLTNAQTTLNKITTQLLQGGESVGHNSSIQITDDDGNQWTCLFEIRLNKTPLGKAYDLYGSRFTVVNVSIFRDCTRAHP
jgi:hypothetical protein